MSIRPRWGIRVRAVREPFTTMLGEDYQYRLWWNARRDAKILTRANALRDGYLVYFPVRLP